MTTTERQNRYRATRRLEGDRRVSIWLKKDLADALSEIAGHLNVTQKHIIENIISKMRDNLEPTHINKT